MTYSEVAQNDNDDDRADIQSSSEPLSPATSSSPMHFLSSIKSSFTPLSMVDSDLSPGVDRSRKDAGYKGDDAGSEYKKGIASTATTAENNYNTYVTARATEGLEKSSSHHEYEPLSPGNARSPFSTNPKLENTSAGLGSAVFQRKEFEPTPENPKASSEPREDHGQARDPSSVVASPKDTPKSPRTWYEQKQGNEEAAQPTIVKPKPIIRTASTKSVSLRHPTPDSSTRPSPYPSSIAQLEATAERLSLTSSIEDAIRDLHEEQKRNESRRSSILAASIGSIPEVDEHIPFTRQISGTSSILETNTAARQGGYSPAGFLMSQSNSLHSNSAQLRSDSTPLSRPDVNTEVPLSRHGPGKSSVRSVRSIKPTLTHIDEMAPTTLTPAAMDAADKLPEVLHEDETLRIPPTDDNDITPNARQFDSAMDYWDQAVADAQRESARNNNGSPARAGSTGTYDQAEMAFADFDGAHCSPDADFEDVPFAALGPNSTTEDQPDHSRPALPRPLAETTRPKSYVDPDSGNTMLYYPARVPMMLNLPGKLSKRPKAEVRNVRRSQVLSAMPEANRKSGASWLPEYKSEPLDPFGTSSSDRPSSQPQPEQRPEPGPQPGSGPDTSMHPHPDGSSETQPQPLSGVEDKRKSRMSVFDTNKRKSQVPDLEGLPPQLRASAFFDLPSESPAIELRDGSAMATLDSILDASAKAPVSAFTDHVFAGSLGPEVYGVDKKRKSHLKKSSNATSNILEPKKRSSFLHLRKHSGLSRNSKSDRHDSIAANERSGSFKNAEDEERQRLSGSVDGERVNDEAEDESEDEEVVYNGPPTTLLAELQMRKQQQKMRTRPLAETYPHGMHSTLLELDTVAEIERQARKGKKVNLAWEGAGADGAETSEDEDTPLGLLMAKRNNENEIVALADLHRPPGLMEQKEMEENEPLSRRRDRLQGRENGPVRPSLMTLNQGFNRSRMTLATPNPRLQVQTPDGDRDADGDDNEEETLGARMRRLRAEEEGDNPLPRARPVSSSFSTELLGQLSDAFKDEEEAKNKEKEDKGEQGVRPVEEEETLGQRRRRLQAERETGSGAAPLNLDVPPKLNQRQSMADVLNTANSRSMLSDPRAERARARREEAARYRSEQDLKLAAFRAQIPSSVSTPTGQGHHGGFMAGRFNDGNAGGLGQPRNSTAMGGYGTGAAAGPNRGLLGNTGAPTYAMGGAAATMNPAYGMPALNHRATLANPYAMQMQMPAQPPAQIDMVERWRQSVWP